MAQTANVHPPAMWAQRNDIIYLTYNVECRDPTITFTQVTVSFKGVCLPDNVLYQGTINLYAEICPEKCTFVNKGRFILVILQKANCSGPFWPRLTTENVKHHWLRVDFAKMREENDSDDDLGNKSTLEDMMRQMGGLDDMKDKPTFDEGETDSDDDCLPDLEG